MSQPPQTIWALVAMVAIAISLGPREALDLDLAGFGATLGAPLGAVLLPASGWMLMRRSCQAWTKPAVSSRMKPARQTSSAPHAFSRASRAASNASRPL